MIKQEPDYAADVIDELIGTGSHSATKFLSPRRVVRATRKIYKCYSKKKYSFNREGKNIELTVTIGRPNHREEKFIKDAVKVGYAFPLRQIWLKPVPERRV